MAQYASREDRGEFTNVTGERVQYDFMENGKWEKICSVWVKYCHVTELVKIDLRKLMIQPVGEI